MRGHGRSDSPEDPALYSQALTLDDMAALLDTVAGAEQRCHRRTVSRRLHVPGIPCHAAGTHPRADAVRYRAPDFAMTTRGPSGTSTPSRAPRVFERDGLAALGSGAEVKASSQRSARGLAGAARGMLAQIDASVIDSLPHIAVPCLLLVGAEDKGYLTGTDYMARKIPGARKVVHRWRRSRVEPRSAGWHSTRRCVDFLSTMVRLRERRRSVGFIDGTP